MNFSPTALKIIGIVAGILGYVQASVLPVLTQTPTVHAIAQGIMIAGTLLAALGYHQADAAPSAPAVPKS